MVINVALSKTKARFSSPCGVGPGMLDWVKGDDVLGVVTCQGGSGSGGISQVVRNDERGVGEMTGVKGEGSIEAFADFDVDAEGAVLVAEGDDGDVAVDVVFDLDDLLLGGGDIGFVGDGEIAGDLLLDGDAGAGVLVGGGGAEADKAGIDAEAGDAKEAFEAAADLAGDGFGEEGGGAGGILGAAGAGGADGGFAGGLAEGEEGDDIAGGKGRIGAIGESELAGGTAEIEGDFILLNGGDGFDVEDGVDAEGVGKIEVAAIDGIAIAGELEIAGEDVNVAEENGVLPGAADAKLGFGFEFGAGPFDAGIGSGDAFDIELEVAEKGGAGGGGGEAFLGGDEHAGDFEALGESDAPDLDASGEEGGLRGAGEM